MSRVMPNGERWYYAGYWGWRNYVNDYYRLMLEAFEEALR